MSKKELSFKVGEKTVIIRVGDFIIENANGYGWAERRGRVMEILGGIVFVNKWPFPLSSKVIELRLKHGNYTIEEDLGIDVGDIITNRSGISFTVKSVCEDGDYYIKKDGSEITVLWREYMARDAVKSKMVKIEKKDDAFDK